MITEWYLLMKGRRTWHSSCVNSLSVQVSSESSSQQNHDEYAYLMQSQWHEKLPSARCFNNSGTFPDGPINFMNKILANDHRPFS